MRLSLKLFAALGGFLFGYDTSVINGAVFQMKDHFGLSQYSWVVGLIVSIAIAGAFVGACIPALISSRWGRRPCLAIADVLFIVGSVLMAAANGVEMVLVGRAVVGLGIGISSATVPVYLAEITPAAERGATVVFNSICLTGAQFVASAVTAVLVKFTPVNLGWRVALGIGALPAIIQLIGLVLFLPESPRWLLSCGKVEMAREVAAKFDIDICDVEDSVDAEPVSLNYRGLFKKALRKRMFIGCMLHVVQQFSGINTIMYYSSVILYDAGFKDPTTPVILSIPLAGINTIFTILTSFTVDRWGRRLLLQASAYGCFCITVGMTAVGFSLGHRVSYATGGWVFLALLGVYLAVFAPGLGTMPWVVMGEIFPNHLRTSAASVATMSNWASNAVVSQAFPSLMGSIGVGGTFSVLCGCIALSALFIQFFVVETKGLSLEQIEEIFEPKRSPSSLDCENEPGRNLLPSKEESDSR
ncbi:Major facilitator [Trypanosoma melophagium]|uniref:Major facilitator n=1 Tax=Trypanosoma melophagium TaxID=715481 RepID=UPI00351A030A|nr:Major facilitator [Trypanosoma melophagium]